MDQKKTNDTNRLGISSYKSKLRDVKAVKWPGTNKDVGIMLLNCAELQEAAFAAHGEFAKRGIELVFTQMDEYNEERVNQLICLFLVDPDSRTGESKYRIFRNSKETKESLSNFEREFFAEEYNKMEVESATE